MKKFQQFFALLCGLLMVLCGMFACTTGSSDNSQSVPAEQTAVTLDLFESKELDASGLSGEVTWKSNNENVVTVSGGIVSAVAEGTAEVTATAGGKEVKFTVKVEDSGDRPTVARMEDITVYETRTVDLSEIVSTSYKNVKITEGVTYTYTVAADCVRVDENGVLTGIKAGIDQVSVVAQYRGYKTTKKVCNVTVLAANEVKPEKSKISLSTAAGDIDPTSYEIKAEVIVDTQKVEGAIVTASVTEGEAYVELDGLTVKAKAVGKAVITLSYTAGEKPVTGTIEVTVHDDKVTYNPNYLVANDASTTFAKVSEEGEFTGAWEYVAQKDKNFWERALVESTTVMSIVQNGYKAFSYDVYFVTSADLSVYIPSAFPSESGSYVKYDLAGGHMVTEDMPLLVVYDEDGSVVKNVELETEKWYTVVYDLTTYEGEWSMLGFTMDNKEAEQKAYLKNFYYYTTANLLPDGGYAANHGANETPDPDVTDEKDAFIDNVSLGSAEAKLEKVVSGDFAGSYKYSSKTAAYTGRLSFNDVIDADGVPGRFFEDGNHYIQFEVYVKTGTGFGVCNWLAFGDGDDRIDQKYEGNLNASVTCESFYVYSSTGRKTNLGTGAWYTVIIEADYDAVPDWGMIYFGLAGSKWNPSVAYIRNVQYSVEAPELMNEGGEQDDKEECKDFVIDEANASVEKVKEGEFADAFKYTSYASFYNGRLMFSELNDFDCAAGAFYSNGNKYLSFKIYCTNVTALQAYINVNWQGEQSGLTDGTLAAAHPSVKVYNENGKAVTDISANMWYTVVLRMDYEGSVSASFVYIGLPGTEEAPAVAYIKDLTYSKEAPVIEETGGINEIERYSVESGQAVTVEVVEEGDFKGTIRYTNKTNEYSGRVSFTEINTANATAGTFYENGYKYASFRIYCASNTELYVAIGVNTWTPVKALAVAHTLARVYDADGNQVDSIAAGEWYTVVMKIEWTGEGNPAPSFVYVGIAGSEETPAIAYFKELAFFAEAPDVWKEPDGTEAYSAGDSATVEKVTEGAYADTIRYTSKGNHYPAMLCFAEINDNNGAPGTFYTSGSKYVSFKILFVGDTSLYACNYGTGEGAALSMIYFAAYDENGNKVAAFTKDVWYTVVMHIEYTEPKGWSLVYIGLDGSEEAPAVAYLKDLAYSAENPVQGTTDEGCEAYSVDAAYAKIEKVTDGEFAGAFKYTSCDSYYNGRLSFTELNTANLTLGSFYADGYKYVSFQIYCTNATALYTYINVNWAGGPDGYAVNIDSIKVYDANGARVNAISAGTWYTVVMPIEYSGEVTASFVYVGLTGSADAPAVAYIKNLTFSAEEPAVASAEE